MSKKKKQYGYYYCDGNASKFRMISDSHAVGFSDIREQALNEVGKGMFAVPRRCRRLTKKQERLLKQYGLVNLLNGTKITNKELYDKVAPRLYFTKLHLTSESSNLSRGSMIEHFHMIDSSDNKFKSIIDMRSYSLFLRYGEAMCCVTEEENHTLKVTGLISNYKGHGKKLMMSIVKEYEDKTIILSCHGDKMMNYFSDLGFKVGMKFKSEEIKSAFYYKMVRAKIRD